jgi:iduronate 2-sulfatase
MMDGSRVALATLAAALLTGCGWMGDPRPDVLLILADDASFRVMESDSPVRTPSLDALAERGRRFDRAYCQFPLCNPSRTSLFTGWRPERTAVWGNRRNPAPYVRDALPLQEHFEQNGYLTVRVGKAYHSRFEDAFHWSYVYDTYGGEEIDEDEEAISPMWGPSLEEEELPDVRAATEVIRLLSAPREKPRFIVMGLLKPHAPWVVPQRYFDLYPPESFEASAGPGRRIRGGEPPRGHWAEAVAAYSAAMTFADAQVGRVLEALARLGRRDETIVIFTSDNGFHLGEHGIFGKNTLYEESARVPLVIAGPGLREPGTPTRGLVELVDLYPTLIDLCGLPPVTGLDGVSLRPLLQDPEARVEDAAFTVTKIGATWRGLLGVSTRTERYRYTVWPDGREELYDHEVDPSESVNLADRPGMRATIERLRDLSATRPEIRSDRVLPRPERPEGPADAAAES